jgi:hypothetical protein
MQEQVRSVLQQALKSRVCYRNLLDLTGTPEFEENGNFCLVCTTWQNDKEDLDLAIEVNTGQDETVQRWNLRCKLERGHNLVLGWHDCLEVTDDHILLWPHTQKVCSLWFSGSGQNALTVVGDLWQEHHKLIGNWFSFPHFLNAFDLVGLVAGGHGKLAEGPEPLIAVYQQVMQRRGFKTSVTSRPPTLLERSGLG